MSVYKRPGQSDYSYDFRYRQKRFSGSTGCPTKRDAERFEARERERVAALFVDAARPLDFSTAAARYWTEVAQHLADSDGALRAMDWLEREIGGTTMLADIDDAMVARLVAARRGETIPDRRKRRKGRALPMRLPRRVSAATVNRTVTQPLRAILRRAARTWRQAVQDIKWKDHFLPEPQERIREATKAEEASLSAAVRTDYAPALRFALLTGCRRMEIVNLRWAQVDFFSRQFTVLGKRDRTRTVPMTKAVYDLLWSQKDFHPEAVFTHMVHRPRDGQTKGTRVPITAEGFKTEWRRTRKRAGVTDFKFHDTRHTAATRLVRATGNLKQAQRLLGHTEISTTARYAHVTVDDLRAGLEAVDAIQAAPEPATKAADNAK